MLHRVHLDRQPRRLNLDPKLFIRIIGSGAVCVDDMLRSAFEDLDFSGLICGGREEEEEGMRR